MCVETLPLTSGSLEVTDTDTGAETGADDTGINIPPLGSSTSTETGGISEPGPADSMDTTQDPDLPDPGSTGASTGPGSMGLGTSTGEPVDTNVCGDGDADIGEECDDGNRNELDGCDHNCQRTARFAFVTVNLWVGGELTLESADATCNSIGNVALGDPYPATKWKAWMSGANEGEGALERLGEGFMPIVMIGGDPLVDSVQTLGSGVLAGKFNRDEMGNPVGVGIPSCADTSARVWTFTDATGAKAITCDEAASATVGSTNDPGVGWTAMCDLDCGDLGHIYCVEID